MSAPVTAVVILNLKPDAAIEQPAHDVSEIFAKQEGFQRLSWGRWEESPDKVQMLIDWDNLESHRKFENSGADYKAVLGALKPVLVAPPSMYHIHFDPHPISAVLEAPVVALTTFYSLSATFETDIAKLLSYLEKADGFLAVSHGFIDEELAKEDGDEKGKAYLAAIGWSSVDAHVKATTTKEIADAIQLTSGGSKHVEVRHVKFKTE
ncbi:hypothetical protein V1525DRAFT_399970 [Lipomyces kononenkoae]|uniref:Uncharacterized protein n=1 Tax=Lipomyces kononenkoae TaxID=34357 RepID=A0ACC3T4S9_LIPKO